MPELRFGDGKVAFSMDDDFTQLVRRAIDRTMPGVFSRLEQAVDRVYTQAVERAPVDTGAFRASIQRDIIMPQDLSVIRGRVYSDIEYGKFIRSPRTLPGTGSAFVELFRKPMTAEGDALITEVGDILRRTLG